MDGFSLGKDWSAGGGDLIDGENLDIALRNSARKGRQNMTK